MKITTQQVVRYFISQYIAQLQKQKHLETASFFKGFFTRSELMQLLYSIYGDTLDAHLKKDNLTNAELLDFVTDGQILSYYLKEWEREQAFKQGITPQAVWDTLQQLQLHTHYLGTKVIAHWDEYDYSNFRSLQRKAGKVQPVFGLFDSTVAPQDVDTVTTPPKRWYPTNALALMAREEKGYSEAVVQVLKTYKAT